MTARKTIDNGWYQRVALDPDLIKQLVLILGEGCVRVVGGVTAEVVNGNNNRPWEKKKRPVEV